jgi:hypothetical protein
MCAAAEARGAAACGLWIAHESPGPCKTAVIAYENEDCWWGVVVEERMHYDGGVGDHANRLATFWVDPTTFKVMAANDVVCAGLLFSLPALRALHVRRAKGGRPDDCDGATPTR